jgi:hypothetical protein
MPKSTSFNVCPFLYPVGYFVIKHCLRLSPLWGDDPHRVCAKRSAAVQTTDNYTAVRSQRHSTPYCCINYDVICMVDMWWELFCAVWLLYLMQLQHTARIFAGIHGRVSVKCLCLSLLYFLTLFRLPFCFFVCSLFNDPFPVKTDYIALNDSDEWMINWKGLGRNGRRLISRKYSGICLEGLRKLPKTSVRIACLRAEFWTRDLPNTNQEW